MKTTLAVMTLLALAGCVATTNPDSPGTENEVFADLPAAPGMTPDRDPVSKNYGHKSPSGGLRSYNQHYTGSRRLEETRKWYEEAFPQHGWTLVNTTGADPVTLTFEKRMEKVDVTLKNERGLLKAHVRVGGK